MLTKYESAFLDNAVRFGQTSASNRLKVGCMFVRDGNIVSHGVNGTPAGWPHNDCEGEEGKTLPEVLHAEENAILKAARDGISLKDTTIYLSHSPCLYCASKLVAVGVNKVVFSQFYRDDSGIKYLTSKGIPVYYNNHLII
jgi:dCMP deaminase